MGDEVCNVSDNLSERETDVNLEMTLALNSWLCYKREHF